MRRLYVSAAHKSSGKTTLTVGLCAALIAKGLAVQPFKKGPDYIDPMWLSVAAGRTCWNLDFHTQSHAAILAMVAARAIDDDVALIEGNKGLHDGVDLEGSDSSAALAKLVDAAVVMVVDTSGVTRGIAPLLAGYRTFDPAVRCAGVILNKVAGPRHESKLRAAIERYVGVPVLGAVRRSQELAIAERHLGLIPSNEIGEAKKIITRIQTAVEQQVDLNRLLAAAATEPLPAVVLAPVGPPVVASPGVRIAVARDAVFGFYYPDDLAALEAAGAEVVFFDTLRDSDLPPAVDGLFIGGGFPETHMRVLEANKPLRITLRQALQTGLPTYAECGGLMYLSRRITWQNHTCAMVGALPADIIMHDRPCGRGYMRLVETTAMPWPGGAPALAHAAHEFHYSSLENLESNARFAYKVVRGEGITGRYDGLVIGNTLATYAHMRSVGKWPWAWRFVAFVESCRRQHKTGSGNTL